MLTASSEIQYLYFAISFLIEIFSKWAVGLQSQADGDLEASDFPELSGWLATSCSDHKSRLLFAFQKKLSFVSKKKSRLLFKSTVPRHGRPCDSRGITHHNPMPECRCLPSTSPSKELCNCNCPPREVAYTRDAGVLQLLTHHRWSIIHNSIWAYLQQIRPEMSGSKILNLSSMSLWVTRLCWHTDTTRW